MRFRRTTLLFASAMALGAPVAPAIAAPAHMASPTVVASAQAPAATPATPEAIAESDAERYEQREKDSKRAGDFQGGSVVIVLSGTGLVIALLVLLLIT
ncbi:MAG: hypothetical protein AB7P03_27975 [Kofleriaceae bacterium]